MSAAGCPVEAQLVPENVEKFRIANLEKKRGTDAAGSSPALAFQLGRTSLGEVKAWAAAAHAKCSVERKGSVLRCVEVPAGAADAPDISDLFLQFDASERLVAVDAQRHGLNGRRALAYLHEATGHLNQVVGPATRVGGKANAASLDRNPFERVAYEYSYRDYVAELSAMNYGKGEVRVREQYQWLPPGG